MRHYSHRFLERTCLFTHALIHNIQAHARGLSIGLKNDLDQIKTLQSKFDWALNEQCNEYKECATLKPFVTAGKAVFGVEYTGKTTYVLLLLFFFLSFRLYSFLVFP